MSDKKLTILAIVAALMVFWAVGLSYLANRPDDSEGLPGYLIEGLALNSIASVEIVTATETIDLRREGKIFVVANKSNYPASTGQINDIIASTMDIKPAELTTESVENHDVLGVSDSKAKFVISFKDATGKTITGTYLSEVNPETGNVYARKLDEDKVYMISEGSSPELSAMTFIEQELVTVDSSTITSVKVTEQNVSYTLSKEGEAGEIVLDKMPAGKVFKGTDYKSVFEALTSFQLEDVKKSGDETGLTFDSKYECKLADSTVYTISLAKKGDKYFAICSAAFTDEVPTMTQGQVESPEELQKKETILLAIEKALIFDKTHKGWIYEIAPSKGESMTKKLADLVEDEKVAEEAMDAMPKFGPLNNQ